MAPSASPWRTAPSWTGPSRVRQGLVSGSADQTPAGRPPAGAVRRCTPSVQCKHAHAARQGQLEAGQRPGARRCPAGRRQRVQAAAPAALRLKGPASRDPRPSSSPRPAGTMLLLAGRKNAAMYGATTIKDILGGAVSASTCGQSTGCHRPQSATRSSLAASHGGSPARRLLPLFFAGSRRLPHSQHPLACPAPATFRPGGDPGAYQGRAGSTHRGAPAALLPWRSPAAQLPQATAAGGSGAGGCGTCCPQCPACPALPADCQHRRCMRQLVTAQPGPRSSQTKLNLQPYQPHAAAAHCVLLRA